MISDFDLVIIGGYYNDNRTAVDSFLAAVLDKDTGIFHAVCKIRNGLSRADFRKILTKLEAVKRDFAVTKGRRNSVHASPAGIEWANANPDFWVDPEHSVVLKIKASEMVETTKYRTTHSFRFPRVMEIRWDKIPNDTCTLAEFNTFCSVRIKRLNLFVQLIVSCFSRFWNFFGFFSLCSLNPKWRSLRNDMQQSTT